MKITYDKKFLKSLKKLPLIEQRRLWELLQFLSRDIFHPHLHTKQLTTPLEGFFTFRLNRDYRILFRLADPDTVFLITAKHRKDVYR